MIAKDIAIGVIIAFAILLIIYIAIKQYFALLQRNRRLHLATKPVLGVCPTGWSNQLGMCVEPGATLTVDSNGMPTGAIRGQ